MNISNLIKELKRRNVVKVAIAYGIAGWLIIQIATSVFPTFEFPAWTSQFVVILVAIGFPLSLIFAWAFELTPEGLKKSQEVDITESVTSRTGKKLNGLIITILSMGVIFLLVERVFFAEAAFIENQSELSDIQTASIAVLPFVNMSGDEENEYFSDGLSEELLNGLAKLEDIQVAGRTSSFQFKGTNPDLIDVGSKLGVKHILEGSVRKSGNRIRITAQLIQADNGFHLWSETYDRELTANDIFDIQEEITRKVITELKVKLLPQENIALSEQPTKDIEAYNAYLSATQAEASRRAEDIAKAIEGYNEATRIDPSFSLAYARLAYAYVLLYDNGNISFDDAARLMRENIDQALLINSNEGKAYQALSIYFSQFGRDYSKAVDAAEKAIKLMPNDAMAHNTLQIAFSFNEQEKEQDEILEKAYKLDPLNNVIAANYTGYLVRDEQFEEALELLDKIIKRSPEFKNAFARKSGILAGLPYGQIDESFKLIYQAYKLDPENLDLLLAVATRAKDLDFYPLAEYMTTELERLYPDNNSTLDLRFDLSLASGDYNKAEEIALQLKENYGGERTIFFFIALNFVQGKYKEALATIEEYEPELMQNPPVINISNDDWAGTIAVLFRELARNEEADVLANALCEYEIANNDGTESKIDMKFEEFSCNLNMENYDEAIVIIDDLYFNDKWKSGWPEGLTTNIIPSGLKKTEAFKDVVNRVYEDLHGMRAEVIDWLKAEGEWKEEWEVGNLE